MDGRIDKPAGSFQNSPFYPLFPRMKKVFCTVSLRSGVAKLKMVQA